MREPLKRLGRLKMKKTAISRPTKFTCIKCGEEVMDIKCVTIEGSMCIKHYTEYLKDQTREIANVDM